MTDLWIGVLNISLSASFVALIVIAIRLPLRKAPRIYSYALWAVVFFRLICPFTVALPISAVPVDPQTIPQNIAYAESPAIASGISVLDNTVNDMMVSSLPTGTVENSVTPMKTAVTVGAYLWFGIFLVLIAYGIAGYLRLKYRVSTAVRREGRIYETDQIKTPFVLGFFRPRIYVPTRLEPMELTYVTAHEETHIRRFDHLIKPLTFFITAIHWFNPLVWLCYALMIRDMELSADESVMKRYSGDIRTAYAGSLLSLAVKGRGFFTPLAFGEIGVKDRVKNVLRYQKPAVWVSIAAILAVTAATLFLVAGKETDNIAETAYTSSYDSVSVTDLSDMMGFKTTNDFQSDAPQAVGYIDTAIRTSTVTETAKTPSLDSNTFQSYAITLSGNGGETTCTLYYDDLYDEAFIEKDSDLYETGEDFGRYVNSLFENTGMDFQLDKNDATLFKEYGWTLDYEISEKKLKLGDINALLSFDANTYYFTYHNVLSKDIGLDMSAYGGKNVNVAIYRIHESMPAEFSPIKSCRGIVVKSGNKTVGAFISAGRHDTFSACSLKGKSFEAVTGETVDAWLFHNVQADATEKEMSKLSPEEVIEAYFKALSERDSQAAATCLAKKTMLEQLSANMLNQNLFSEMVYLPLIDADINAKDPLDNLKSAKLVGIEPSSYSSDVYAVTVDMEYKKTVSIGSGVQSWDCTLVYESPETGWKITEFGQG